MLEQLKRSIDQAATASGMPVKIVAIDGHGGAGKSKLARALSDSLFAEIVQTDDFASMENPLDWWPRFTHEVLEPIKQGVRTLNYAKCSWWQNHHPEPMVGQPVTPIMIIEGVSSSRQEFRPFLTYSIWVEAPKEVCLSRGMSRDLTTNPDNKSEPELRQLWERWRTYEDIYVTRDNPKEYADIVVDGTKAYEE